MTLTDHIRRLTDSFIIPTGQQFKRWGIHPDTLTVLGLGVVALGSLFIAEGQWGIGGIILLLGLPLDALDGATARAYGVTRPFGAFLDSTLDRYADALIFGAFIYGFAVDGQFALMLVALVALHGTMTVSYARARAEGLTIDCKVGLFTRFERVAVILIMLFVGTFWETAIAIGMIVLAVGTQFTALQRILHVRRVSFTPLNTQQD